MRASSHAPSRKLGRGEYRDAKAAAWPVDRRQSRMDRGCAFHYFSRTPDPSRMIAVHSILPPLCCTFHDCSFDDPFLFLRYPIKLQYA